MTSFLLWIFGIQGVAILAWSVAQRQRMVQFPFLVTAVFMGWVFPQLIGLSNNPYLPPGSLEKTLLMANLCLGAAWIGYAADTRPAQLFWWQFNRDRLFWAALFLSLGGAFFFYQISLLAPTAGTRWTGIITIYAFMAKMLTVGMVLGIILYMARPSWPVLLIIGFDLIFYFDRILIKGRRADMVELAVIALMAMLFYRRWVPPRLALIGALVLAALIVNSAGDYRATMLEADGATWSGAGFSDVLKIDYLGNLTRLFSGESGNFELTNATLIIEATDRLSRYDFGLSLWNEFVNSYMPGQWIGYEFKDSLTLDFGNPAMEEFQHIPHTGSTLTGLADAFRSFWFFGAIKFLIIGLVLGRWYRAAMAGNIAAQMILMLTITPALHAPTHSTSLFFLSFVQIAAFLFPVLLYSRISRNKGAIHPVIRGRPALDVRR